MPPPSRWFPLRQTDFFFFFLFPHIFPLRDTSSLDSLVEIFPLPPHLPGAVATVFLRFFCLDILFFFPFCFCCFNWVRAAPSPSLSDPSVSFFFFFSLYFVGQPLFLVFMFNFCCAIIPRRELLIHARSVLLASLVAIEPP